MTAPLPVLPYPQITPAPGLPALALLYRRVSTTDQATDGVSLASQTAVTRRYAAERGMQIGGEYEDVLSGRRDDRPRYVAMLQEARRLSAEGRRVVIVVAFLHRLGRRLLEQVRAREELEAMGAAVHAASEGGEVTPFVANVLAAVAEQQARDVSVQVAANAQETRARGWLTNVPAVWGYQRRASTPEERAEGALLTTLEPAPAEVPSLVRAFEMAAQGQTIHAIARWVATLPPEAKGGRALTYSIVRALLHSPLYIARQPAAVPARPRVPGSGAQRATRRRPEARLTPAEVLQQPVGRWPALLSDDLWLKAQQAIDQHRRVPKQGQGAYLLTGLVRCPRCGARMSGATLRQRERRSDGSEAVYSTRRYVCESSQHAGTARARPCRYSVHGDSLEASVLGQVGGLLVAFTARHLRRVQAAYEQMRRGDGTADAAAKRTARALAAVDAAVAEQRATLVGLTNKYALDKLSERAYRDATAAVEQEITRLEGERAGLVAVQRRAATPDLPTWSALLQDAERWGYTLSDAGRADPGALRETLTTLVDHLTPERRGYARVDAVVAWTPAGAILARLAALPTVTATPRP